MSWGEQAAPAETAFAGPHLAEARGRVGRVVEIRVRGPANLADIEALRLGVSIAASRANFNAVVCGDYRRAAPMSRDVASAWARAMRSSNPAIAHCALLLDPSNAMFNLQIERVVRCAGHPTRRLFADRHELHDWLDGYLNPREREALRAFLAEGEE